MMRSLHSCLVICLLLPLSSGFTVVPAIAQLVPDRTLGAESSIVTPLDDTIERIEQGAVRGENLFHSFESFSVGKERQVYFANPPGIRTILSRVTGHTASNIWGTLGVDGDANLFFLNPSGIVFGPDARLDVAGSFVASTSDRFSFTDGSSFSAIEPDVLPLLSVNVSPGLQLGIGRSPITNEAQLIAGQDLTLRGNVLDLEGQIVSGGDLWLEGDRVQIRDNALVPFIAQAGGALVVEGNTVDISALSHPESRLVSGGDMALRSGSPVIGDARYWSGGTFRIETLERALGVLSSIDDPVIRSAGDVELAGYEGASLHILAGGRVTIPDSIVITGADPDNGLVETLSLSDGSIIEINGRTEPTLDIRAGTEAIALPEVIGDVPGLTLSNPATGSGITIGGTITNPGGTIFLTNQYQPNLTLPSEDINVGQIDAATSDVVIDARGMVNVTGNITASTFGSNNAGDIRIIAESLQVTNQSFLATATSGSGQAGNITIQTSDSVVFDKQSGAISQVNFDGTNNAGDIAITTRVLDVLNSSTLSASTFGDGNAGDIAIRADEAVRIAGNSSLRTAVDKDENNLASIPGNGDAGNMTIETNSLFVEDQSELRTRTFGVGNGGNININASGQIIFDAQGFCPSDKACGAVTQVDTNAQGNAGAITINTNSLMVQNGAVLASGSFGQGNGGTIEVNANDVYVQNGSRLLAALEANASGNGGSIGITANRLEVTGIGAALMTSTAGRGDAGEIKIEVSDTILFDGDPEGLFDPKTGNGCFSSEVQCGAISQINTAGQGNGGVIDINAGSLFVQNGATLTTTNFSHSTVSGDAGSIIIDADNISITNRSRLSTTLASEAVGNSGDISITTDSLSVTGEGAVLITSTAGNGDAGNIWIESRDSAVFNGTSSGAISQVDKEGQGHAGNTQILH